MILSAFEQLFLLGQKRLDTGCDGALFKLQAREMTLLQQFTQWHHSDSQTTE